MTAAEQARLLEQARGIAAGLEAEIEGIARWLCAMGYGFDFWLSGDTMPEVLRWPLARAYFAGVDKPTDETPETYYWLLAEECGWDATETAEPTP